MPDEISLRFTKHALERMFQRGISPAECELVFRNGNIIEEYQDDKPFPSKLLLGYSNARALHIVISIEGNIAHVITAYEPNTVIWDQKFERRSKK